PRPSMPALARCIGRSLAACWRARGLWSRTGKIPMAETKLTGLPTPSGAGDPTLRDFAPADVAVEYRSDGSMVLRSPQPLGPCPTMNLVIDAAAALAPSRGFLAERSGPGWRKVDYRAAPEAIRAI